MSYENYINLAVDEMNLRGYSPRTIEAYSANLRKFLLFINKPVDNLSTDDVRTFLLDLKSRHLSTSYINGSYSVCQLFFKSVLKQPFSLDDIPRVKNSKKLPVVLSRAEVNSILDVTLNLKHKAILMTAYSSGLRVSEVVNLKLSDIDSENMQLLVRSGKGDKDRYTLLSQKTLLFLRQYYKSYRPTNWLFYSGYDKTRPLSSRTAQKVFKDSTFKAGISKSVTIHTLRHSFATHLLMNGANLVTIQTLLGHKNIKTTMVYLHLAPGKILSTISPFDMEVPNDK